MRIPPGESHMLGGRLNNNFFRFFSHGFGYRLRHHLPKLRLLFLNSGFIRRAIAI
jgi:hypothetical protein